VVIRKRKRKKKKKKKEKRINVFLECIKSGGGG
jgi:hypothetical protein